MYFIDIVLDLLFCIVLYCFIVFFCFFVFWFFHLWWFTGVSLWGLPQVFLDSIKKLVLINKNHGFDGQTVGLSFKIQEL